MIQGTCPAFGWLAGWGAGWLLAEAQRGPERRSVDRTSLSCAWLEAPHKQIYDQENWGSSCRLLSCFFYMERPREAQRSPESLREAQRRTERPREAQRGPERPREAQREAQRGPERPVATL